MDYAVGDMISFKHIQGAKTEEQKWSSPTRLIGFDGNKLAWGLREGVPVCLDTDKMRPCAQAETLAYLYLHRHHSGVEFVAPREGEQ